MRPPYYKTRINTTFLCIVIDFTYNLKNVRISLNYAPKSRSSSVNSFSTASCLRSAVASNASA